MSNSLPKYVKDDNGFTHAWNRLLDWARASELKSSTDILVNRTSHGTSLTLANQPSSTTATTNTITQFKVVSDGGDYIMASPWNGSTTGSAVKVAKPAKLRTSITAETINGVSTTYTYTASLSGSVTQSYYRTAAFSSLLEYQQVIPFYLPNDIIYAAPFSTSSPTTLSSVTFIDLNADGRAWSQV